MAEVSRNTLRDRPKKRSLNYQSSSSSPKKQSAHISSQKSSSPKPKSYPTKKDQRPLLKPINSQAKLLTRLLNTVNRYYYESKKREECKWQQLERRVENQMKNQVSNKKKGQQALSKRGESKKIETMTGTRPKESVNRRPTVSQKSPSNNSPLAQGAKSFGLYKSREPIRKSTHHIAIAHHIFLNQQANKASGEDVSSLDPALPAQMLKAGRAHI